MISDDANKHHLAGPMELPIGDFCASLFVGHSRPESKINQTDKQYDCHETQQVSISLIHNIHVGRRPGSVPLQQR